MFFAVRIYFLIYTFLNQKLYRLPSVLNSLYPDQVKNIQKNLEIINLSSTLVAEVCQFVYNPTIILTVLIDRVIFSGIRFVIKLGVRQGDMLEALPFQLLTGNK